MALDAGYDSVPFPRWIAVFPESRLWAALLCQGSLVASVVEARGLLVHGDEPHVVARVVIVPK